MTRLDVAISVWGKAYVDTMLMWALPSFLARGNLPACAKMMPVRITIVTRPEDVDRIVSHPIAAELQHLGELNIVPLLTADKFDGSGRYDLMAACHRLCISESLRSGSIIALLSPDCLISDGSLAFGLQKILDGKDAILVSGPRAELEPVTGELEAQGGNSATSLSLSGRQLSSFVARYPHAISRLLFWHDQPFSQFPSAIYWREGEDSFLARYFHLHPLLVNLAKAAPEAATSGTIDGTLMTSAKIGPEETLVVERSDEICVIELSRADHDPMGSLPQNVTWKSPFVARWAIGATDASHREQFKRYFFRFQGQFPVNWDAAIANCRKETWWLDHMLDCVGLIPKRGTISCRIRRAVAFVAGGLGLRRQLIKIRDLYYSRSGQSRDHYVRGFGRYATRMLTPGPAVVVSEFIGGCGILLARSGVRLVELYGRLRARVVSAPRLGTWANRPLKLPDYVRGHFQNYFDAVVVPYRAQHPGPFTWFIARLARFFHICFVVNIAPGTGHNTVEVDYFLRRLYSSELDPHARYVFIRDPTNFHMDTLALYRKHFWFASSNRFLRNVLAPTIAGYPELRIDCGLSRLKWNLRDDKSFSPPPRGQTFLYQVSKEENRAAWLRYYRLRRRTSDIAPLSKGLKPDEELVDFLGGSVGRLALLHSKFHVANATAAPTDPDTYLDAIKYLQAQGYQIVHVGRESMPTCFKDLGVLNYAESAVVSYRHDLQLFAIAKVAITAGSGIALIPDCMGIPFVYLNSWHIGMPMASQRCVMVPTLLLDRHSSEPLSFRDQFDLYFDLADKGDEIFPADRYKARNATADEVLSAVREVLALGDQPPPFTPLQQRFRTLDNSGLTEAAQARVSEAFLRKHIGLLDCGVAPTVETAG